MSEVFEFIAALLVSLGGATVILFALTNYLGKIWANRLMQKEIANHDRELATLRGKLELQNEEYLSSIRNELEIYKETHLKQHSDKILIYRAVIDIIAEILSELEMVTMGLKDSLSPELIENFGRERLKIYGYLGMLAPQAVMDTHDKLMDHLIAMIYDGKQSTWEEVRTLAINFINKIREDIGIDKSAIEYRGER